MHSYFHCHQISCSNFVVCFSIIIFFIQLFIVVVVRPIHVMTIAGYIYVWRVVQYLILFIQYTIHNTHQSIINSINFQFFSFFFPIQFKMISFIFYIKIKKKKWNLLLKICTLSFTNWTLKFNTVLAVTFLICIHWII